VSILLKARRSPWVVAISRGSISMSITESSAAPSHETFGSRLAAFLRVIGYQRFALGMVIALIVLMTVPQIREFLLIYPLLSWPGVCEVVFVGVSALAAWYAGRMAYRIDPNPREPGTALELKTHPRLRRWLPRAYALAVPMAPALACWQLGREEKVIVYVGLALLLFFGVTARRRVMQRVSTADEAVARDAADERVANRWRDLGLTEKRVIFAAFCMMFALFVVAAFIPHLAAAAIGTTGLLFLSGSVVAIVGTVIIQQTVRAQLPFTLLLLVALGLTALVPIGKQHLIRSAQPTTPSEPEQRDTPMPDPFTIHEPVLVAAEGGGIRAAYWAALALHTLDLLTDGGFRQRVTLASGVSGGSLGLATYAHSVAAPAIAADDCVVPLVASPDDGIAEPLRALNLGHCFLAEDYLGPVAMRLLWHDMPRLLAPIPFWTDRGEALEDGWSTQWQRLTQRDDFDRPLASLDVRNTIWVFNTTHVESGRRVIQSMPWIPRLQNLAPAAIDGRTAVGTAIELKQAVHNSARFTYVSPTGAVDRAGSVLQLADGGYYENSGLTIINDWLLYEPEDAARAAASAVASDPFAADAKAQMSLDAPRITGLTNEAGNRQPVVLLLSNDPSVAPVPECAADQPTPPGRFENEVIAPVDTLLQVRSARGAYAREQARRLVGDDRYFQLAIRAPEAGIVDKITVPLGWALSEESIDEMQRQMWCAPVGCGYSNADELIAMVEQVGDGAFTATARRRLAALCASSGASVAID
jgi:hypothetical protein